MNYISTTYERERERGGYFMRDVFDVCFSCFDCKAVCSIKCDQQTELNLKVCHATMMFFRRRLLSENTAGLLPLAAQASFTFFDKLHTVV